MDRPAIDPGALLARSYPLPDGGRVRLRLLRRSDAAAVRVLLATAWAVPDDLELLRLLRFDPRRRLAIAAVSLRAETLLGAGAIDLAPGAEPDLIVVDPDHGAALEELIAGVLRARARRRRAA
jgi:cytosine/adenosine deaminase-related metal-dependent hydrolase